jgi:hypothetical protein
VSPSTTTTAATTTTTAPVGETSYKDSAQAITVQELVDGRVNAPNLAIGTVVTFSGVLQQLLFSDPGQVGGLILADTTSSASICIQLSARATTDDESMSNFMNVTDMVTIWGAWQGTGSVADFPLGPKTCPAVVAESYLRDTTTGQSDDES